MAHGAGGKATQTLVDGLFVPAFGGDALRELGDAGVIDGLAMTTDSFVVKPIRFPGGSIGELAVNGTVNDLAMAGARPLALTLSLVLEEGLSADDLRAEVEAIAARRRRRASRSSPATPRSSSAARATRCTSTTTGLGRIDPRASLSPGSLRPGDRILLSGPIGEHGTAVMLARGEFELEAPVELGHALALARRRRAARRRGPVAALPARRDPRRRRIRPQRDRPGVRRSRWSCARPPCRCGPAVAGACEILGIDPMYVANEGVLVAFVAPEAADDGARRAAPRRPAARSPRRSARSRRNRPGMVLVETAFGGRRVMDLLVGDPLPRIC